MQNYLLVGGAHDGLSFPVEDDQDEARVINKSSPFALDGSHTRARFIPQSLYRLLYPH